MKKIQRSHSSFSALAKRQQPPPTSFREALALNNRTKSHLKPASTLRGKFKEKEKSFSDSESSEASCLQKKFYRCGCLNHNKGGCGHQYQNYLAQLRDQRLRKRASSLLKQRQSEECDSLCLSEKQGQLISNAITAAKGSKLLKILEQPEQAENSKAKLNYSISITIGKRAYFKKFKSKEQLLFCFSLIQKLIQGKL